MAFGRGVCLFYHKNRKQAKISTKYIWGNVKENCIFKGHLCGSQYLYPQSNPVEELSKCIKPQVSLGSAMCCIILANCQGLYNPISLPFKERTRTRLSPKFPSAIMTMSSWPALCMIPKKVVRWIRDTYDIKFLIMNLSPGLQTLTGMPASPHLYTSGDSERSPVVL